MDIQQKHTICNQSQNINQTQHVVNLTSPYQFQGSQATHTNSDMPGLSIGSQQPLYQPEVQLQEPIQFTMQTDTNYISSSAVIQISEQSYVLIFNNAASQAPLNMMADSKENIIYLEVPYRNTQNLGTSANSIVIFIDSNGQTPQNEDPESEQEPNSTDQLIGLMKKQQKGNFILQGQCTLTISFMNKQKMQKAYQLLSLYVGEEDEGADEYEEDQGLGEMISADNIDENGNIILNQDADADGQEEENNEEQNQMEQGMEDEGQNAV